MDVRVYSKREIEFLNELYFREFTQYTHWPLPSDSIPPEHDGNSERKPVSQNQGSPSQHHLRNIHTLKVADWKHSSMTFGLFGRNVCRTTYQFTHGIGIKRYKRLSKHHDESGATPKHHDQSGATPKHHGSSWRVACNAYSVSDQQLCHITQCSPSRTIPENEGFYWHEASKGHYYMWVNMSPTYDANAKTEKDVI